VGEVLVLRFVYLLAITMIIVGRPVVSLAQDDVYRLNPGDVLNISVWKEEEMTRPVAVLPDGTISFPLAGHLKAAGLTAAQVQAELVKRIKKYIAEPVITVSVEQVAGNIVFVIGQVNNPGQFPIVRPTDVMQALSIAGGLTPFGDEDDIMILRRENGRQVSLPFDYSDVKRGKNLELNIVLKSGDVVVVPD
jgi:polysaccharide export outer membrane protein